MSEPTRFKDTLPIDVDEAAATAYVRLSNAPVARTCEQLPNTLMIDYGSDGYPVGIEIHLAGQVVHQETRTVLTRDTLDAGGRNLDGDLFDRVSEAPSGRRGSSRPATYSRAWA